VPGKGAGIFFYLNWDFSFCFSILSWLVPTHALGKNVTHATDTGYWGLGIYLAPNSSLSLSYCRGGRKLLICGVLMGHVWFDSLCFCLRSFVSFNVMFFFSLLVSYCEWAVGWKGNWTGVRQSHCLWRFWVGHWQPSASAAMLLDFIRARKWTLIFPRWVLVFIYIWSTERTLYILS
jgi:hypothetical protein